MANIIKRVWNQNRMVQIEDLRGMTFQAEAAGHTFQISGIDDDGNTVALTGTPSGVLLRPDNTDVALTCSVSGGVVSATLPANCYDVPGRFGLTIFITSGSSKTAIYAAVGTVTRTSSGTVAPGTSQSVVDLINAINAAVNSIPASYSALLADIAPTYSDSALYSVGQYAWYDGDLKRCIVPITTAESYTAAHWTSAVLGQDVSDLKSALNVLEDEIGSTTKITDFSSSSLTTWAGLSNGLCINKVAIENLSGKVEIEFYDNSSDPTYAYWFILYEEKSTGTLTVVDKKQVNGHSTDGVYSVDTGWVIEKSKKYYIGLWNSNSNRFKYVSFTTAEYPVMYKTGIYTSSSDIVVDSTVAISNLSTANDRSIFCNITVITNVLDEIPVIEGKIETIQDDISDIQNGLKDVAVIAQYDPNNITRWTGMAGRVVMNEIPIIHESGKVRVKYYADGNATDFLLLLYRLTSPGVITLEQKYEFTSSGTAGIYELNPNWTVRNDRIYYVALFTATATRYGTTTYKYHPYYTKSEGSASSLTIGSTLNIHNIESTLDDRSFYLDIIVDRDKKDYPIPHVKRYAHFSVDDCVFWKDLITNKDTYTSAFENPNLKMWKYLHDLYGITVTLNCFCTDSGVSIADVPSKFANEFKSNINWLRFAFHAEDSDTSYSTDDVSGIKDSYETFVTAIIKMTGTPDAIDSVTRLGFYAGSLNNVIAIRDENCGVRGLLTSDDSRASYYLDEGTNTYILSHNWVNDTVNHIILIHTLTRLESVNDVPAELNALFNSDSRRNQNTFLEFFTHELQSTNRTNKIATYCTWLIEKGVDFAFAEDVAVLT